MGKFSGPSVLPGGQVELPTGTSGEFDDIFEAGADTAAAPEALPTIGSDGGGLQTAEAPGFDVTEPGAIQNQEQRERERIPSISEQIGGSLTNAVINQDDPFGAALGRGTNVNNVLKYDTDSTSLKAQLPTAKRDLLKQGFTEAAFSQTTPEGELKQAANPALKDSQANIGASQVLFDPRVLDAGRFNDQGYLEVDPEFSKVLSLGVENYLWNTSQGTGAQATEDIDFGVETEANSAQPTIEVSKAHGNQQLGREIYQQWKRQKAALEGKPTDSYLSEIGNINPDTFTFIGDMAKEVYSQANPDLLYRPEEVTTGEQVYFQITPKGVAQLKALDDQVKGLFGIPEVKPLNAISETAQPVHEASQRVRPITTKVGDLKDWSVVQNSMANYHSVAYVNDPKREAMAFQYGILGLLNHGKDNVYANMFDIGANRRSDIDGTKAKMIQEMEAESDPTKKIVMREAIANYNPESIAKRDNVKFLKILSSIAEFSGKANHPTFSLQALTGRTHIQQTSYNPQAHKVARFVIGGGNNFNWRPGQGKIDSVFREVMSAYFLSDSKNSAKDLTTPERLKLFSDALNSGKLKSLAAMGKEIGTSLAAFDAAGAKADIQQVVNAKSPQEANEIKKQLAGKYNTDPLSQSTKDFLAKHKDEGPIFAEALVELARYVDAIDNNLPMKSNISIEMDGKTHGPATNAAQLGVEKMAERTGLLRTQDYTLTDDIDSRKAMGEFMVDMAPSQAGTLYPAEKALAFNELIGAAVKDRGNFLKKSPMTMGYGQELGSLKMHVKTTVFNGPQAGQIQEIMKRNGISTDDAVTFLHTMLVDSLFNVMDPKVVAVSRLLRANNLVATLTNEVLYMDNAMGFRSYAAAKQTQVDETDSATYGFAGPEGSKSRSAQFYRSKPEGSAVRSYEEGGDAIPGGYGHGRVIPIAVQSYDGNMISRTGTGSSWEKIKNSSKAHGGKPFVVPIFDAFKTDLGSFDAVREEANKNWVRGLQEHSYVTAIMDGWFKETAQKNREKFSKLDPSATVDVNPDTEWRGLHYLFKTYTTESGVVRHNLQNLLKKVIDVRPKMPGETIKDYQLFIGSEAGKVMKYVEKSMAAKGIPTSNFDQLTNGQIQQTINIVLNAINISRRNGQTVRQIQADKDKLFAKYRANNREARQVEIA